MTPNEVFSLCSLRGSFTESRLLKWFSKRTIGEAVSRHILSRASNGIVEVNRNMANKLMEGFDQSELNPGEDVFKYENGSVKRLQVVKDDSGEVAMIDPEKVDDGVKKEKRTSVLSKDDVEQIGKELV